jgi:hypothetical protein
VVNALKKCHREDLIGRLTNLHWKTDKTARPRGGRKNQRTNR